MAADSTLMDMFVFETTQLIDQLETILIDSETNGISSNIDEIFRIMHTIKGSAAMMQFDDMSHLAHSVEDLFFFLREKQPTNVDYARLTDIVLDGMDFIKNEIEKIQRTGASDAKSDAMRDMIRGYLETLKTSHDSGGEAVGAANGTAASADVGSGAGSGVGSGGASTGGSADPAFADVAFDAQDGFGFIVTVRFEDGCGMEHLRAFELRERISLVATEVRTTPSDLDSPTAGEDIVRDGLTVVFASELEREDIEAMMQKTVLMKSFTLQSKELKAGGASAKGDLGSGNGVGAAAGAGTGGASGVGANGSGAASNAGSGGQSGDAARGSVNASASRQTGPAGSGAAAAQQPAAAGGAAQPVVVGQQGGAAADAGGAGKQSIISVNVSKLDKLMNLVGELVTAESMVSQNPDLNGLQLDNFNRAARQLQKIINELQEVSMSVRMVPLSLTFQKMHRIVRDMCRKLGKEVTLEIIGEETEVDKNIIEQITNPLMHLVRNAVDHGIEMPDDREENGKKRMGTVTLEAKNESSDVWIIVKDDGLGLDRDRIYEKAKRNGLTAKSREELSDREINAFVLAAGFSTNEAVTEYSGRGVGMDVVVKGIEAVGGSVILDSAPGLGTTISIKIPLTLAIMEGMIVNVGETNFVIPITAMKESFKADEKYNIADVNGEDIIMIRGEPTPIVRLRDRFSLKSNSETYYDGIMIMIENEVRTICLHVDMIIGQRSVVVKPLPEYIKEVPGISGCTLLGDGSISLILDVAEFLS